MSLVEVRAADLTRVGQLEGYSTGQIIPRWCGVGSWRITVPGRVLVGDQLDALLTGGGIVVTDTDTGNVIGSGPLTQRRFHRAADTSQPDPNRPLGAYDPGGAWELIGATDEIALQDRLIYPDPTSAASSQGADAHDDRSGAAETVLRGYVNANAGPSALLARRSLLVEPDLARGVSVASSYRFYNLLDACAEIATASGIGFRVVQDGNNLVLQIIEPRDLTARVVLTFEAGTLAALDLAETDPDLTRAIVAGQGVGTARVFREIADTAAEATWARRIERAIDRRDTNDTAVLDQAGADAIAAGGARAGIKIQPVDTESTRFARDYGLGDIITAGPLPDQVREVVYLLGRRDSPSPVIGDPSATDTPELYQRLARLEKITGRSAVAD